MRHISVSIIFLNSFLIPFVIKIKIFNFRNVITSKDQNVNVTSMRIQDKNDLPFKDSRLVSCAFTALYLKIKLKCGHFK